MEDFIEVIFYIVILALSGIGSLMKNRKKQQKSDPEPNREVRTAEPKAEEVVVEMDESNDDEENELIRMLREAAAAAEAQQREKEALEQRQREVELRKKELEEQQRKAEMLRREKERLLAKQQLMSKNQNLEAEEDGNNAGLGLNLSDISEVSRAFVASEILNKKYS